MSERLGASKCTANVTRRYTPPGARTCRGHFRSPHPHPPRRGAPVDRYPAERKRTQTPAEAGKEQGNNGDGHGSDPSVHRTKPDQEPNQVTAAKQGGVSDGPETA